MTVKVFQVDPAGDLEPFAYERGALAAAGAELVVGNCETEDEVIEKARAINAEVFWVAWLKIVGPRVMDAVPSLRLMIRWGVGYEQISVPEATRRGIAVANCPAYGSDDVAEHAVTLLLSAARRVTWFQERMRNGDWGLGEVGPLHRMKGRTVGIVGVGRIGSSVSWRLRGLGFKVIGYDKYKTAGDLRAIDVEPVSLEELLERSDYVTLHVPLSESSFHMLGAPEFARMKDGAVLVNTARGPVVDEAALIEALNAGKPAFAAIDVMEQEPLPADAPIRRVPNLTLTPHVAGYSVQAFEAIRREISETTTSFVRDGWAPPILNPEVRATLRPRLS